MLQYLNSTEATFQIISIVSGTAIVLVVLGLIDLLSCDCSNVKHPSIYTEAWCTCVVVGIVMIAVFVMLERSLLSIL